MNAIASWSATTGLAEAARRSAVAAKRAGVDIAIQDVKYWAPTSSGRFPPELQKLPRGRPHEVDVYFLNVNEIEEALKDYEWAGGATHYRIGSWFWELGSLPNRLFGAMQSMDEIWVPTTFVRDAFLQQGARVVTTIPCVVEPVAQTGMARSDFGLPPRGCLFLFHFDAHSTFARKNPFGLIEAFRRAFGSGSPRTTDVRLVMKVLNLDRVPEAREMLLTALDIVGGVLIESEMSSPEVGALLACCDVYASLHRAEGFGLGIAEAMYFRKPVIATAFSGPCDFMTPRNSCMVGYRPRTITAGDLYLNPGMERIYEPGRSWAEPDVGQAARWMRWLAARPTERRRIGGVAHETVRTLFSSVTVGTAIRSRLKQIAATSDSSSRGRARHEIVT